MAGEGPSETVVVETLVGGLLGWDALLQVTFEDLGGSGAASRVESHVGTLDTYAMRTLIIVDSEGQMAEFLTGAIRRGAIDVDNVCLFQQNLEQSNATPEELIDLASELARNPPPGREPVELRLNAATLRAAHKDRGARASGKAPGLADVLLDLAASDEHGPVRIDKPELAEALALMLLRELDAARGDEEAIEEIRRRRPIVRFVLDRLVPVINVPRPAGID